MTGMSNMLKRLTRSPWALSCASFAVTALLIRANGINPF